MNQKKILVVDDEPDILQLLEISLSRMGLTVYKAENLGSAKFQLEKNSFHLCLTDYKLPDGTGIELVEYMRENYPNTPIAVITAFGTINHAVDALKKGAYDFITKPISLDTLRNLVVSGLNLKPTESNSEKELTPLQGVSPYVTELNEELIKLGRNTASVMFYGPQGSWKTKYANMIHAGSQLSDKAITVIDCSLENCTIDSSVQGSLLFEQVDKLDQAQQTELLSLLNELEEGQRVIATTHLSKKDLANSVGFKKALLRRVTVSEVTTVALAEHKDDLNLISKEILTDYAESWNRLVCKVNGAAMTKLKAYDFPGDLNELELILAKAAVKCHDQLIREDDIELDDTGFQPHISRSNNLEKYIEEIEIREISNALEKTKNNKTKAAKLLGISFRALRYKIKKLDID
ncbi:MAG: response regulator [Proteobacteria bacterium]|nr:response regulator [Pseudomonadota bacterium]